MNLKRYYIITTLMLLIVAPLLITVVGFFMLLIGLRYAPFIIPVVLIVNWVLYIKSTNLPEKLSQILLPFFISFGYYMLVWVVIFGISGYDFTSGIFSLLFLLALPYSAANLLMGLAGNWTPFPVIIAALTFVTLAATLITCAICKKKMIFDKRVFIGIAVTLCLSGIAVYQNHARNIRFLGQDMWVMRVEDEVDMQRYRPFSRGNNLMLLPEPPNITFTENFPRLDGATAAYPVFAAIAQALYIGLDQNTVTEYVSVSRTDIAYRRLINGEIDIFFGAEPSREHREMAEAMGLEFNMIPVAREAFVFFVHRDNPVESLTVEQIRDIYQRRITNWRQVGGANERIMPFQRPENSGSQTIMLAAVMGERPMAQPLMEERFAGMGAVVTGVATYRNYSSAIGYSFRYFVTGMRPHEDIRLLAVNGIAPTIENIQNGSYPFIVNIYAITIGEISENTERLIEWILSEQGQAFIELCGVVPIVN